MAVPLVSLWFSFAQRKNVALRAGFYVVPVSRPREAGAESARIGSTRLVNFNPGV